MEFHLCLVQACCSGSYRQELLVVVREPTDLRVDWIGVSLRLALLGYLPANELSQLSCLLTIFSFLHSDVAMSGDTLTLVK